MGSKKLCESKLLTTHVSFSNGVRIIQIYKKHLPHPLSGYRMEAPKNLKTRAENLLKI
jgi:hypothetical protein